jgi:hypothetical protein
MLQRFDGWDKLAWSQRLRFIRLHSSTPALQPGWGAPEISKFRLFLLESSKVLA